MASQLISIPGPSVYDSQSSRLVHARNENSGLFSLDDLLDVEPQRQKSTDLSGLVRVYGDEAQPRVPPAVAPIARATATWAPPAPATQTGNGFITLAIAFMSVVVAGLVAGLLVVTGVFSLDVVAPQTPGNDPVTPVSGVAVIPVDTPIDDPAGTDIAALGAASQQGLFVAQNLGQVAALYADEMASMAAAEPADDPADDPADESNHAHTETVTVEPEHTEVAVITPETTEVVPEPETHTEAHVTALLETLSPESETATVPVDDPTPTEALPETLSNREITRALRSLRRTLSECRELANLPAGERFEMEVDMTIGRDGAVSSAASDTRGEAASCVLGVMRDAEFDAFSGDAINFSYPVLLR